MSAAPKAVGEAIDRVDGRLKVTGAARYAAEMPAADVTHGVMVQSTIAAGRITAIDRASVEKMPGVLLVLTHENAPTLPTLSKKNPSDFAVRALSLLQDDQVHYNGEPIAVVVADTLERATDAAHRLTVAYAATEPAIDPAAHVADAYPAPPPAEEQGGPKKPRGDADAAFATAKRRIDATYTTPMEHHNPMEPHAVIAVWSNAGGEQLTVYDSTQSISGSQTTIAQRLGLQSSQVRVVSHFIGGGFGSKGSTWSHVILAAMAARIVGRPVKLACTRRQMFGPVGGRPTTMQHVQIGANDDGTLAALKHDVISSTSVMEDWTETSTSPTRAVYAVANLNTSQSLVRLNVGVPTFQRAPGESTGNFAIESAMDELAYACGVDPLQLRLRNYAERDPESGHPWSSKALRECYRVAAEKFGWASRSAAPLSMRRGHTLVGWGMATAAYPSNASAASCKASIAVNPRGELQATFEAGTQDIGTGTYTVMTQVAADALGVPWQQVRFELGDSRYPVNPGSGGSRTAASTGSGVYAAGRALREKLIALAIADARSPLHGAAAEEIAAADGVLYRRATPTRRDTMLAVVRRNDGAVDADANWTPPESRKQFGTRAFGAVFAEVHVDDDTRQVRIPRIVAAYGVNPLNRKTALSQFLGGIVWGVGMALTEETRYDVRNGRIVTADLAEYRVPVNADIADIDITIVPEPDTIVNPVGVKGIGEIGITGAPAAIANAVYHATGIRVRDLPIVPEKLLPADRA